MLKYMALETWRR